jgi:hypothetical protein
MVLSSRLAGGLVDGRLDASQAQTPRLRGEAISVVGSPGR